MDSYLGSTPGTTRPSNAASPEMARGLFNVGLDLSWAILEGLCALQHGTSTIELCRDRGSRSCSTARHSVTTTPGRPSGYEQL